LPRTFLFVSHTTPGKRGSWKREINVMRSRFLLPALLLGLAVAVLAAVPAAAEDKADA
jgi:hypothetical protein